MNLIKKGIIEGLIKFDDEQKFITYIHRDQPLKKRILLFIMMINVKLLILLLNVKNKKFRS